MQPLPPTEDQECIAFTAYLRILQMQGKILLFGHVPSEMHRKPNWALIRHYSALGVAKGVPDYIIVTPEKVLFVEMKRIRGGVVSPEQKQWLELLDTKTTATKLCKGFPAAKEWLDNQLSTKTKE